MRPTIIGHTDTGIPIADPREFAESALHREQREAFYKQVHGNVAVGYLGGFVVYDDDGKAMYTVQARTYEGDPL